MNTGGVSKPSTRSPVSSLIDRLNGPRTRRMPCSRSQRSAVPSSAAKVSCAVLGVQHPEEARGVGVALEMQRVDLRADPPDRLARRARRSTPAIGRAGSTDCSGRQVEAALDDERLDPCRVGREDPRTAPSMKRSSAARPSTAAMRSGAGEGLGGHGGHRTRRGCRALEALALSRASKAPGADPSAGTAIVQALRTGPGQTVASVPSRASAIR